MSHNTKRRAALSTVCRHLLFAFLTLAAAGCTCRSNHTGQEVPLTEQQQVEQTFNTPATFDAQTLHEFAALTTRGPLTAPQLAAMITATEAALNKFEAQLEELLRNDDAADSHAVLTEWADTEWPSDMSTILSYLSTTQLPPEVAPRAATLVKAADRARVLITQIEQSQLKGKPTGLKI